MHPIHSLSCLKNKHAHTHRHIRTRTYSNSASLQYRESNPICLRRINSGGGNLSAAKFYLLKTTLAFHSLAVCLFFLFFTSPSRCLCLLPRLLSCGFPASSARSISTNERGLYEGVSCFPSLEQAALIWSNGYWLDHWFIELVISALYQHLQRKGGREKVQRMEGRSRGGCKERCVFVCVWRAVAFL